MCENCLAPPAPLLLRRSHHRVVRAAWAPILERPVVQARLVARITRGEEQQASLLADVAVRDDALVRLYTGGREESGDRRLVLEMAGRIGERREGDVESALDV